MKFITIPKEVEAIQFNGKNYKKIEKFVKQNSASQVTNIGRFGEEKEFFYLVVRQNITERIELMDWIVIESRFKHARKMSNERFNATYIKQKEKD